MDGINWIQHMPCFVQVCDYSGLANRLRGWFGIGAVADSWRLPLWTCWLPSEPCKSVFTDLFCVDRTFMLPLDRLPQLPNACIFRWPRHMNPKRCATSVPDFYRKFSATRNRAQFVELVHKRRHGLRLLPALQARVDAFVASVPAGAVGVHIRRTDFPRQAGRDQAMQRVLDAEIAAAPDIQFVLCADNPGSVAWLRSLYGARIHWRPTTPATGLRLTTVEDAAIDLWVLSRMSRIIGTRGSSFSQNAAALGGIVLKEV